MRINVRVTILQIVIGYVRLVLNFEQRAVTLA